MAQVITQYTGFTRVCLYFKKLISLNRCFSNFELLFFLPLQFYYIMYVYENFIFLNLCGFAVNISALHINNELVDRLYNSSYSSYYLCIISKSSSIDKKFK